MTGKPTALDAIDAHMRAGAFGDAAAAAQRLVGKQPGNAQALYRLAVCQRYLGAPDSAAETLDDLAKVAPDFARLWQERGHLAKVAGDAPAAIAAYREAVRRNDALAASWRNLAALDNRAAGEAAAWLRFLASLPPPLLRARGLRNEGRVAQAEQLCRDFLKQHPRHIEAMRLLAAIGVGHGIYEDAEFLLESAVEFAPGHRGALVDYIDVLHKRQKFRESLAAAERLLAADKDAPANHLIYANQAMAAGDFTRAPRHLRRRAGRERQLAFGARRESVADARTRAEDGRGAPTKRSRPTGKPRGCGQSSATPGGASPISRSFASARRNGSASPRSWKHPASPPWIASTFCSPSARRWKTRCAMRIRSHRYSEGNAWRRRQLRYDAGRMTRRLELQRQVCDAPFFRAPAPAAAAMRWIRSSSSACRAAGSTLLEQILASHSAVDGTLELHHIGAYAAKLDGRLRKDEAPRYPGALTALTAADRRGLGMRYLDETRIHRRGAPRFVDKMPNNFRHLGLIHLILPNAKIIDARRHPLACCFSNFKQRLRQRPRVHLQPGRSRRLLPGTMWRSWATGTKRCRPAGCCACPTRTWWRIWRPKCDGCSTIASLPFEAACLRYWETERFIRTPSAEQVRRPINRDGLEHWRRYEPHLGPLKDALGECAEA